MSAKGTGFAIRTKLEFQLQDIPAAMIFDRQRVQEETGCEKKKGTSLAERKGKGKGKNVHSTYK